MQKHLHLLLENGNFTIEKGDAVALLEPQLLEEKEKNPEFTGARSYETAFRERIAIPFKKGELTSEGPSGRAYDDRKPRFAGIQYGSTPVIYIGPGRFPDTLKTNSRAIQDPSFYQRLREEGLFKWNDPSAYFSNTMATASVAECLDGIVVFKRSAQQKIYPDQYHVFGNMFTTDFSFWNAQNPTSAFLKQAENNVRKAADEELNRSPDSISLLGIADGLSSVDLLYESRFNCTTEELAQSMNSSLDSWEHSGHKVFTSNEQLAEFMKDNEDFVPQGYAALLLYLKKHSPSDYQHVKNNLPSWTKNT